jgi:hypothetical protein
MRQWYTRLFLGETSTRVFLLERRQSNRTRRILQDLFENKIGSPQQIF